MTAWKWIGNARYGRCTKHSPCPICGKPDWCLIRDDGMWVFCPRVEGKYKRHGMLGWPHRVSEHGTHYVYHVARRKEEAKPVIDWKAKWHETRKNTRKIDELAGQLRLPRESLLAYGAGTWSNLYTWPMYDGGGNIIGIRTRDANGNKRAIYGSRNGLFLPKCDNVSRAIEPKVYICEGPTDAAALWVLGLYAIGKPSADSGHGFIGGMNLPRRCVMFADRDKTSVGYSGCKRLIAECGGKWDSIVIVSMGITKDIREMIRKGLDRNGLEWIERNSAERIK